MKDFIQAFDDTLTGPHSLHEQIDTLNALANEFRQTDVQHLRPRCEKIHTMANAAGYKKGIAESHNNLAWCNFIEGNLEVAMGHALNAAEIAAEDDSMGACYARALSIKGILLRFTDSFPLALENMLEALKIAKQVDDHDLVWGVTNDISLIYLDMKDYASSLKHLNDCLEMHRKLGFADERLAIPLNNLAIVYMEMEDYARALEYCYRGLEINEKINFQWGIVSILINLGLIHKRREAGEEAEKHYRRALAIAREEDNKPLICHTLMNLGEYFKDIGDADAALPLAEESFALAQQMDSKEYHYQTHQLLAEVYALMHEYEKAYTHYYQYHELWESFFNDKADNRTRMMQAAFELENVHQEKEMHRLRSEMLEREIEEQKRTEESRIERSRLHLALEKEQEFNAMKTRMMERIAHEFRTPLTVVHTSNQVLTRYTGRLSADQIEAHHDRISKQVHRMTAILDDIVQVLQSTYNRLDFVPETVSLKTLTQNIVAEYQNHYSDGRIIRVDITEQDAIVILDQHLYRRAVMGVLDNALKFSPAKSEVVYRLRVEGDRVRLTIQDQGIGIPLNEVHDIFLPFYRATNVGERPGVGLGLAIVRDCVTLLNGTITVDSIVGEGTSVTIELATVQAG